MSRTPHVVRVTGKVVTVDQSLKRQWINRWIIGDAAVGGHPVWLLRRITFVAVLWLLLLLFSVPWGRYCALTQGAAKVVMDNFPSVSAGCGLRLRLR